MEESMIERINALGDACPLPVIKAKKALREHSEILIQVDNEIATQNLKKMAEQLGYQVKIKEESEKEYKVHIFQETRSGEYKDVSVEATMENYEDASSYVVVIPSRTMGVGSDELGETLLKMFIYSLTEQDILPSHLLFYNEGAKLATTQSSTLEDLKKLKEANVEILTCGACLDYFDLKEELAVGEVTNMYHILELMSKYHVVRP
jgi:selenium metabolism protein YedF